jgi:hypothetical protein
MPTLSMDGSPPALVRQFDGSMVRWFKRRTFVHGRFFALRIRGRHCGGSHLSPEITVFIERRIS